MKTIFAKLFHIIVIIAACLCLSSPLVADSSKININTATETELCLLKRIGPSYASRIIAYRETNGPFKSPEDITKVRGIGMKTFEANKDTLSVGIEETSEKPAQ